MSPKRTIYKGESRHGCNTVRDYWNRSQIFTAFRRGCFIISVPMARESQEIPQLTLRSRRSRTSPALTIKPGTKKESVHIPVVLSQSGPKDMVYNDFYVGETQMWSSWQAAASADSQHDGIHRFFLGKNARVKYIEKHYGKAPVPASGSSTR